MMDYWREVGEAAEQRVLSEIQIFFSIRKATSSVTVRTGQKKSKFQQKKCEKNPKAMF